ncbi:hypothetical protein EVAR_37438_1 [Eumeta japonica]|uniref:Uncharacterized protein n=1 Tax=Eumeta variegata TaxID=151549 RepID=A0A4C1X6M6_EUMVA|nr:hypothetical protein EVAR_37438_1 [Eumeta japonica]
MSSFVTVPQVTVTVDRVLRGGLVTQRRDMCPEVGVRWLAQSNNRNVHHNDFTDFYIYNNVSSCEFHYVFRPNALRRARWRHFSRLCRDRGSRLQHGLRALCARALQAP